MLTLLKAYALLLFKILSACFTGVLIALIGQALLDYRYFSFMFIFLTVGFAFFSLVKKFGVLGVILVDLLFILLLVLIKVYIAIASNG